MIEGIAERFRCWRRTGRHKRLLAFALRARDLAESATQRLLLPWTIRRVKRLPHPLDRLALVNLACRGLLGTIRPLQVRSEILAFLHVVQQSQPRRILEIGTANGGTLFLLARVAAPDAQVISLDLPHGPFGGGYPPWKIPLFEAFPVPGQQLHLIRGNSHDPGVFDGVRQLLDGSLDLLFIDGDHTYEGAKQDFETYGKLVRPGGMVALHDIAEHPRKFGGTVHRFWAEIRTRYPAQEFVEDQRQGYGIGLVRL